jgi:hypothetical protein
MIEAQAVHNPTDCAQSQNRQQALQCSCMQPFSDCRPLCAAASAHFRCQHPEHHKKLHLLTAGSGGSGRTRAFCGSSSSSRGGAAAIAIAIFAAALAAAVAAVTAAGGACSATSQDSRIADLIA